MAPDKGVALAHFFRVKLLIVEAVGLVAEGEDEPGALVQIIDVAPMQEVDDPDTLLNIGPIHGR